MNEWVKRFREFEEEQGFSCGMEIEDFIQTELDKNAEEVAGEFISACTCNFCKGSGLYEDVTVYFDEDGETVYDRKLIQCRFCHASGSRINHEHYDHLKQKYIKSEVENE